jgi:hypothetical protein
MCKAVAAAAAAKGKPTGCQTTTANYGKSAKVQRNVQARITPNPIAHAINAAMLQCWIKSDGESIGRRWRPDQEAHRGIRDSGMATPEIQCRPKSVGVN